MRTLRSSIPGLVLGTVTLLTLSTTPLPAQATGPKLEPTLARVGAVGHREERTVDFTISNPTSKPIEFSRVKASCDCMKVRFDSSPIPPGESRSGVVTISFGRSIGEFRKKVEFSVRGRRSPLSLHVFATFHPGIRCKSLEVVLEGFTKESSETAGHVLEIGTVVPKGPPPEITDIGWGRGGEGLTIERLEPTRNQVRLRIGYSAERPAGVISAELRATVNGRPFVMPVRGTVFAGIRVTPANVNFNVVRSDADQVETVELIPAKGTTFQVLSTRFEARARTAAITPTVEVAPRAEGGHRLTLKIDRSQGTGSFGGSLWVETDHPDAPRVEVKIFGHIPAS